MKIICIDILFNSFNSPKELCAYDGKQVAHFVFKPQLNFADLCPNTKKQVRWSENYHHTIPYSLGYVDVNEISKILEDLAKSTDRIYVKGANKEEFLCHQLPQTCIINMEKMFGVPTIEKDVPSCMFHRSAYCYCAINSAKQMFHWLVSKIE